MLEQNLKQTYDSKYEQVDASVRFVFQDQPDYYDALCNLPARVAASLMIIVIDWMEPVGYHFRVLRAAQRQYSRQIGYMTHDEPPFKDEELQ